MSDDTTLPTNATDPDTTVSTGDTDNKGAFVPSHRLKEEADKRRAIEQEAEQLRQQLKERESYVSPAEVAKVKYGADIVESEEVQAVLTKYPNMAYDDAITLAGKSKGEPAPQTTEPQGSVPFVGRPAQPEAPREMTIEEEKAFLQRQLQEGKITF